MTSNLAAPKYEYIAFIDEAGDPGIKRVAPIDENGASEWFTLGCVLMRASNELAAVEFVRRIKAKIRSTQSPDLHFRKLRLDQKLIVTNDMAYEKVRFFAVVSNKKNMRGYRNPAAEAKNLYANEWFYNYCIRILLERVTQWCAARSLKETGTKGLVKLVFSERAGHRYEHVKTYGHILSVQSKADNVYQTKRVPDFGVLHADLMEAIPSRLSAGCQMADIVASSFFQAANAGTKNWTTEPAKMLAPRMAMLANVVANEGLTLLPWGNWTLKLTSDQKSIFKFYGYQI